MNRRGFIGTALGACVARFLPNQKAFTLTKCPGYEPGTWNDNPTIGRRVTFSDGCSHEAANEHYMRIYMRDKIYAEMFEKHGHLVHTPEIERELELMA